MTAKLKNKPGSEKEAERIISYLSAQIGRQLQNKIEDIKAAFQAASGTRKLSRTLDKKKLEALAASSLIYIPVDEYFDVKVRSGRDEAQEIEMKIREMKSGLQLTDFELAKLLGIAPRTFGYWKSGKTKRPISLSKERLGRVFGIYRDVSRILKFPFLRRWLFEPGQASGDVPYDLLVHGRFERVQSEIEALKEGVYA